MGGEKCRWFSQHYFGGTGRLKILLILQHNFGDMGGVIHRCFLFFFQFKWKRGRIKGRVLGEDSNFLWYCRSCHLRQPVQFRSEKHNRRGQVERFGDFSTGGHIRDHSHKANAGGCNMKCWNSHHTQYFPWVDRQRKKSFDPGSRYP